MCSNNFTLGLGIHRIAAAGGDLDPSVRAVGATFIPKFATKSPRPTRGDLAAGALQSHLSNLIVEVTMGKSRLPMKA